MIRNLFIIAIAAMILSVACFAGAVAVGGHEFTRQGGWRIHGDGWSLARADFGWDSPDGERATRRIAWEGGDSLAFSLPARVIYAQADEPSIAVSGPQALIDRVRFENGRFTLDRAGGRRHRGRLNITITAPSVTAFALHGSQDLEIRDYDQAALTLGLHGSGDVEAWGRAGELDLTIRGSGDADLANLAVENARIGVHGSGDAVVAAMGRVEATVHGSGDVELTTRPARLDSVVHGSGRVRQPG